MALLDKNIDIFYTVVKIAAEEDEKVYEQLGIKQDEQGKVELQPGWKLEHGVFVPPKTEYKNWEWPEESAIDFRAQTIKDIREKKEKEHAEHLSKIKSRNIPNRKDPNDDPIYKQIIEQKLKEQKERDERASGISATEIHPISPKDKQALHELENHFSANKLAAKALYQKYEDGKNITKQEIPLIPRKENSKLKPGSIYLVLTTAQISGLEPEIVDLSLKGNFNITPSSNDTLQSLDNMSFIDAVNLILKVLPEYEYIRIEEKAKEKAPVKKRTLLPDVKVAKKGPNTLIAALHFPARQFPVDHPQIGRLRSNFDEKLIGIRITRQKKVASNAFLEALKIIEAAGYKSVYKQRINPESGEVNPTLTPDQKTKLKEEALKNLKKKEEKFDVYIMTEFTHNGEPKNELYVGAVYAVNPEDALNQIVRVSGGSEGTGYSKLLERAFRLAHGLEKPLVTPKQMEEHRENILTERETPAKGSRKDKEEALERFLEREPGGPIVPREKPPETPKPKGRVREVTKEELERWKK